jgi:hypothetical protein
MYVCMYVCMYTYKCIYIHRLILLYSFIVRFYLYPIWSVAYGGGYVRHSTGLLGLM